MTVAEKLTKARRTRFQPGQILVSLDNPGLLREVVDVRSTGYGWKYPDIGERTPSGHENYWWSENSSDPFLDRWNPLPGLEKTDDR